MASNPKILFTSKGGAKKHNILDGDVHLDSLAGTVVAGDIIIGNATPKWARLAKDSQYKVLQMGAALPEWEFLTHNSVALPHHRKMFRAYSSVNQSIPPGTDTKIVFDVESYDLDGVFDNVTNYRYLPGEAGYYWIGVGVYIESIDDGQRFIVRFWKNGAVAWRAWDFPSGGATPLILTGSVTPYLTATDYVEVYTYHSSATAKNIIATEGGTWFAAFEL
jgi:hypothetical protein